MQNALVLVHSASPERVPKIHNSLVLKELLQILWWHKNCASTCLLTTLMNEQLSAAQSLDAIVSPQATRLCKHVRLLATGLRDRTDATPLAAETLVLANEVESLCDYIDHLHGSVETLLVQRDVDASSLEAEGEGEGETNAEQGKAKEIQRETHQFNPGAKDIVKALFMWRDSPQERLRDVK